MLARGPHAQRKNRWLINPHRGSDRRPDHLDDLALVLRELYDLTGDVARFHQAVRLHEEAAAAAPADLLIINDLGGGLWERYGIDGRASDMEDAFTVHTRAIKLTEPDSPDLPLRLANLGGVLRDRFRIGGDRADLARAVQACRRAVNLSPRGAADRPRQPRRPRHHLVPVA
ncbi:tetratricopeptide repeat protein [Nonomuraea sp. NPDC003201]